MSLETVGRLAKRNLGQAKGKCQLVGFSWRHGNSVVCCVRRLHAEHFLVFLVAEIGHALGFRDPRIPHHR